MTLDELKELLSKLECDEIEFNGKCHDCGKEISVMAGIDSGSPYAYGGAVYKVSPPSISKDNIFIKCDECFIKDKVLRNWRPTEVYSRVVGYLRPIGQWNKGKKAEWEKRKMVIIDEGVRDEQTDNDR